MLFLKKLEMATKFRLKQLKGKTHQLPNYKKLCYKYHLFQNRYAAV